VTSPPGVERQSGGFILRPAADAKCAGRPYTPPDAVKGHAMSPALRIDKSERLGVVFRKK